MIDLSRWTIRNMGVYPVKTKNVVVPIECVYNVNTWSLIPLSHEAVSEVSEQAHERSE